ncbi:ATP-grasp peptide maturase system methyltransferase [Nonomuraea glycinis]|uniref:Protein-L-isoaspartate O-methyltransferase n=1 Tax=Nonomuraea glycinis TaxID=2047744 RepID=A0A918AEW3_9ACTN|nr:ATP-grasp peptide maturase system methyltransferase [Nonomuraea glycinis]MCA2182630.1 ATP-grasp peptide maturase system methyltransferase [Nonomuraea glycinis]GGP16827.1 protein-L-isoaspartate O-methyltransferase [Nonomuraea glycinis]
MSLAAKLRHELAATIGSPGWRTALETVPREVFLGQAVYRYEPERGWVPVRRSEMSTEDWLHLAYTDETWVTQIAGVLAEDATDPVLISRPTSSSTLPGLVVRMLDAAEIGEGEKIMEIGTGTGYSTALMCCRLGDDAVTSVEFDPVIAARAKAAIAEAGYMPMLVQGDGLLGYEADAPYDRLIATCAVRTIPPAWVRQVRQGGTITAPMLGWTGGVAFAHLHVTDVGTASGRFLSDDVYFMPARPHAAPPLDTIQLGIGDASETQVDPSLLKNDTALFVAQLAAPQAQHAWAGDILTLDDTETGSHADVRPALDGGWVVHQDGPIRIWDAIEKAIAMWQEAGSPHQSGFGLTVTRESQRVWLGEPDGPRWELPSYRSSLSTTGRT